MTNEVFSARAQRLEGAVRVTARGDLDMQAEPVLIAEVARELDSVAPPAAGGGGEADGVRLVIDLRAVTFLDSTGLRGLLRCRDAAAGRGGRLTLAVGENARVARLLEVAGVRDWFDYE